MVYYNIKYNDIANGEGIRTTVFISGCEHNCQDCHNPEAQQYNFGLPLLLSDLTNIFNSFDTPFHKGLSLTGGDPFAPKNRDSSKWICKEFRNRFGNSKDLWLWTGYIWEDIIKTDMSDCLQYLDVLVDGPFIKELKNMNLEWRGSSNQRVIDVQRSLKENKIILWRE